MLDNRGNQKDLYFIALVPDAKVQQEIFAFKMELFEKYGCKTALKSPAHITLVSPFALTFDQAQEIVSHFEGYIPVVHAFELKITGFNTFGNRTFYAQPASHPSLFALHTSITAHFEGYIRKKKEHYDYRPHITIGNRDIQAADLDEILQDYKTKNYQAIAKFKDISLFRYDSAKWQIISSVALT